VTSSRVTFQRGNSCLDRIGCASIRPTSSGDNCNLSKRQPAVYLHTKVFWMSAQGNHHDFHGASSTRSDASMCAVLSDTPERRAALRLHASVSGVRAQPGHNSLNYATSALAAVCAILHQMCESVTTAAQQRSVVGAAKQCGDNGIDGVSSCVTAQLQAAQRFTALRLHIRAAAKRSQLRHQRGRVARVRLRHCASRRGFRCAPALARASPCAKTGHGGTSLQPRRR
jgi:hypothetical protein